MFCKKPFTVAVSVCLGVVCRLFAYHLDFSAAEYAGGIPSGWSLQGTTSAYVSLPASQPQTPADTGESGLAVNFYSATKQNLLYCTSKIGDELVCNTILAKLRILVQPEADLVDSFQVVVSTNAWDSYESVGDPIYTREAGRTVSEWITYSRIVAIEGLAETNPDVYVGILFIPAGKSHSYGYIHSLSVSIAAAATPTEVCLKRNETSVSSLIPGQEDAYISAFVAPDPNDDRLVLEGVYGVLNRNGIVSTNKLTRVGTTDEYVSSAITSAFDAGENISVSVFSKYTATALPTVGEVNEEDGYAYQESESAAQYVVGKVGSVWINELTADTLEVCGTTNRVMSSGWTLIVSDDEGNQVCYAELGGTFDFTTNMINGVVGVDTRALAWIGGTLPSDSSLYNVSLCNSRGIAEHTVEMIFSGDVVMGMTGYASWPDAGYSYDWTGTATDGTFAWSTLAESSFGASNSGQGFNIPVSFILSVNTRVGSEVDGDQISHATVVAAISDLNNLPSIGTITNVNSTSEDGVALFEVSGWTPFPTNIQATLSGNAFGWKSDEKQVVLTNGFSHSASLSFVPTVALDDFSTLADYWSNQDSKLKWDVSSGVLRLNTYAATSGRGVLTCGNYLYANGNAMCSVEFDFRNTVDSYSSHDDFTVVISTNADFSATVVSTPVISNKRSEYDDDEWYHYKSVFQLPEGFGEAPELWIKLLCESQYKTHTYTYVDNLRIAFQDVALPTNLTRTVEAPVNGDSCAFLLDFIPQTTGTVAEVSANLHFVLNGVTNIVPFAFSNGASTNSVSLVDGLQQAVQLSISEDALVAALGGPLMTGDEVKYFAAVHYNSANGATNETEVYETRYFPDNATISNEYWIVEGDYGVNADLSANSFTVTGDPLSCIGTPVVTTEGVTFKLHGYDAAGISSLTLNVNGTDYTPFEGLSTNAQVRVTGEFSLETGLAANTEYTVTISAVNANGEDITPAVFTFVTLPEAPTASIEGVSASEVKLTASGSAAGYVASEGWTQTSANTWTRSGTPNTEFTATVYATNKVGGASAPSDEATGYTLAAVATKAPTIVKGVTTVDVSADYDASVDGNPDGTEYAVLVTTGSGATNYVSVVEDNVANVVWKALGDWQSTPETVAEPYIDLEEVNTFSFVTRNFDEVVSPNENPVTTNCWFELEAGFVGEKADQVADPFGTVEFSIVSTDPAESEGAKGEVEYKIGEGAWTSAVGLFDVSFNNFTATNAIAWDAWTAVGEQGEYGYSLRARVYSGGRTSEWSTVNGTLDFAPPAALTVTGTPANGELTSGTGYDLSVSATDSHDVTYSWTLDGAAGTGSAISGSGLQDGTHSLSVVATDAMGNESDAVAYSWTVDATAPTNLQISGTPEADAIVDSTAFEFASSATDATALSYHWTLNGAEQEGTSSEYAGTAVEGTNSVSVYAEDAAGNACDPVTRTWVVDTENPTAPVISGTPANGSLTKTPAVSLTAASTDVSALTYHWTFNGVESTGTTLEGTSTEGANIVSVYAVDAAGNVSDTSAWGWTLDTTAPADLAIDGTPAAGSTTANSAVALTASATDITEVTYHWTFNGVESTGASLNATSQEGENTASVYAVDEAGNKCATVTRTWTLDTTKPSTPVITGTPANGASTNVKAYEFTAEAEDATTLTYHWTLGETESTGATFSGSVTDDGVYTVTVYATDAAGNEGESSTTTWTLDTIAPTVELTSDTPENFNASDELVVAVAFSEAVTNFTAASVTVGNGTVSSVSASGEADYTWLVAIDPTDDGDVSIQIAAGAVADAAGNGNVASATLVRTFDKTAPTVELSSEMPNPFNAANAPLVVTASFSETVTNFTAASVTVENGTVSSVSASGDVDNAYVMTITPTSDGAVTVQIAAGVVADAARNGNTASEALSRTYDTGSPSTPTISGTPANEALTKESAVSLSAESTDVSEITYHWTFNGVESTGTTLEGTSTEGANTVSVYAVDAAGNVSDTSNWGWTLDTTAPADLAIDGTPAAGSTTANSAVALTASATDITDVTYHWTFNGAESTGAALNTTSQEGLNTASVYAVDEAGNQCAAVTRTWTLDTTKPTAPVITGTPANGASTNIKAYDFAAESEDATALTYHWTLGETESTGETFSGSVVDDGVYTVTVYATDAAGNEGESSSTTWTLDTVAPTVELASDTPENFNAADELVVSVAFSEAVTNFTAASVTVGNGTVSSVSASGEADNTWIVAIDPTDDGEVSVQIAAGAVADAAGNGNVASDELVRTYDTTAPTVELSSETPNPFNAANAPLVVLATFSEPVTNFTDVCVTVDNGTVSSVSTSGDVDNAYVVTIAPTADGVVSVQIAAGVVADAARNGNEVSATLTRTYDTTVPTAPVISGTPASDALTNVTTFELSAASEDATSLTYHWTLNGVAAETAAATLSGTGVEGENTVTVYAKDAAGNESAVSSWTWTLDTTEPTVTLESTTAELFNAEAAPMVVTVTFDETVTGFDASKVTVGNGSVSEVTGSGAAYTVKIAPAADGPVTVQIAEEAVNDEAGNGNEASEVLARTYDTTPPTAALTSPTPLHFNSDLMEVVIVFSETVTGFASTSVEVENGTVAEVSGSGTTYSVKITPAAEGDVTVSVKKDGATDAAGNGNTASDAVTRSYDKTAPTVELSSDTPMHFNAAAAPMTVTVTFSEPVTNFTAASVTVENGTVSSVSASGDVGNAWLVTIAPAEDGAVTVQIAAGAVADAAGNGNAASASLVRTYDIVEPTVELTSETPERFNSQKTFEVQVAFSEAVTNFTAESVAAVNGTVSSVSESVDVENAYIVTVAPAEDGEVSVQIAAGVVADAAGNGNAVSEVLKRTYDNEKPTVELSSETPTRFSSEQGFVVLAAFSEAVTNFTTASVSVVNGTVSSVSESGDVENVYLVTIIPDEDGDVTVSISAGVVADLAGNANSASESLTRTYDNAAPEVTLSSDTPERFNGDVVFAVTATFTEAVTNFTSEAVTVVNGAVGTVEASTEVPNAYIVTILPTGDGDVSVNVAEDAVNDLAGNGNVASDVLTRTYDNTKPTVVIAAGAGFPAAFNNTYLDAFTLTVTFSEAVTNFAASSVSVVNGIVGSVTPSQDSETANKVFDIKINPTVEGLITIQIAEGSVDDLAGNGNDASESLKFTYDNTKPSQPVLSGTPENGSTTSASQLSLTAESTDNLTDITYFWYINKVRNTSTTEKTLTYVFPANGTYEVYVLARDAAGNRADLSDTWTVTVEKTSSDVEFGGGVCVKVDPSTGATNEVGFTAVDFKPGATCTFTLSGFAASTQELTDFQMWFVVSDALGGATRLLKADTIAEFDSEKGELTVTLPASAIESDAESLFIHGVENTNPAE